MPGSIAMAEIHLRFGSEGEAGRYRVAGETVVSWPGLPGLEAFREGHGAAVPVPPPRPVEDEPMHLVRAIDGVLADRERRVECWAGDRGYRLEVEGIGELRVDSVAGAGGAAGAGDEITVVSTPEPAELLPIAAVLGPGMALALARRTTWLAHASAALRGDALFVFLGEGGAGKSTLARYLGERPGWSLVADDLVPVRFGAAGLEALPRYPQPRWEADEQRSAALPESMPVRGVYLLGRELEDGSAADRLDCRRATKGRATLALIRQTVCASLFDDALLESHLEWAGRVADRGPVLDLRYPLRRELLPEIESLLARHAEEAPS